MEQIIFTMRFLKHVLAIAVICVLTLSVSQTIVEASFMGLGDLPGGDFYSEAYGISSDGSVVVGYGTSASGHEAFRWTSGGGMVGLGDLPGGFFNSIANGVSSDGSVVVGRSYSTSGEEAFIWDEANGMRSLKTVLEGLGDDLTGWSLTSANGISGDGMNIVGYGTNSSGDTEAWMAKLSSEPIPEPGTLLLLSSGLLGFSGYGLRLKLKRIKRTKKVIRSV